MYRSQDWVSTREERVDENFQPAMMELISNGKGKRVVVMMSH